MRPAPTSAPRRRAVLAVSLVALVSGTLAAPVAASPAEGPSANRRAAAPITATALAQPSPDLAGLPPISRDLSRVPVDSPAFRRERAHYDELARTLAQAQARRVEIDHALADIDARAAHLRAAQASGTARAAGLRSRLDDVDSAIADLAVGIYTSGGPAARVDAALATQQPSINDADRRDVLGSASLDVLLAERTAYEARLRQAVAHLKATTTDIADLSARREQLVATRPTASDAEVAAAPLVATERVAYEEARTLATVKGVEFPLVALDAYYRASATSATNDPRCSVRWWAIAGIARVEGQHGTYGGASLDELGNATKRIIGIQLNGTNETQVVADSDGGALDGDPVFDRAVGPMQFIPQTWTRFAADGNADGITTPFNLYDAALTAARYLCRASAALDADPGLRTAYFSYNHSLPYVDRVLSFAHLYQRTVSLPDPRD
jgi:membrane-bound lytic murein transglycosylase B